MVAGKTDTERYGTLAGGRDHEITLILPGKQTCPTCEAKTSLWVLLDIGSGKPNLPAIHAVVQSRKKDKRKRTTKECEKLPFEEAVYEGCTSGRVEVLYSEKHDEEPQSIDFSRDTSGRCFGATNQRRPGEMQVGSRMS